MMFDFSWQKKPLVERIRLLRYILPGAIIIVVIVYQLLVARQLEEQFGHFVHYSVEISFYSLAGPAVTWMTLTWIERSLEEKETLERQVRSQTQQLASLASASADAIISLDSQRNILSWNRGARNLFGYLDNEIIGQPLKIILPDSLALEERIKRDGIVQDFETKALSKEGRLISVNLTQTQVENEIADNSVSLIIMRDITTLRERSAVLEEERSRIARDLHDGVAQTLYFLALKADMVSSNLQSENNQAAAELREMGKETRNVIRDIRRTIFALRPLDWSEQGFYLALRQFVEGFSEQVGWQVEFDIDSDLTLPSRLEPVVFRLVQESLNNVAKHADAENISVYLHKGEEGFLNISLRIVDDGIGFDLDQISNGGLGLGQMRQRTTAYGGVFNVHSQPGYGTTIDAQIPLFGVRA